MVQPGKIRSNQQGLIISPILHSETAPYPGALELGEISFSHPFTQIEDWQIHKLLKKRGGSYSENRCTQCRRSLVGKETCALTASRKSFQKTIVHPFRVRQQSEGKELESTPAAAEVSRKNKIQAWNDKLIKITKSTQLYNLSMFYANIVVIAKVPNLLCILLLII